MARIILHINQLIQTIGTYHICEVSLNFIQPEYDASNGIANTCKITVG